MPCDRESPAVLRDQHDVPIVKGVAYPLPPFQQIPQNLPLASLIPIRVERRRFNAHPASDYVDKMDAINRPIGAISAQTVGQTNQITAIAAHWSRG